MQKADCVSSRLYFFLSKSWLETLGMDIGFFEYLKE